MTSNFPLEKRPEDAGPFYDPLFWFLKWRPLTPADATFQKIHADYVPPEIKDKVQIHLAPLSFYRTLKLLSVSKPMPADGSSEIKTSMAYALVTDGLERFIGLTGKSDVIHAINRGGDELHLSEATADEYLRFFCSAVHGEAGPFLQLDPWHYQRTLKNLEKIAGAEEILNKEFAEFSWNLNDPSRQPPPLKVLKPEEVKNLANPYPDSSVMPRRACVAYSDGVFRVKFAADSATGMVMMLDDEPVLAEITTAIPNFQTGGLFNLYKSKSQKVLDTRVEPRFQHFLLDYREDDAGRAVIDKLLSRLSGGPPVSGKTVSTEILFETEGGDRE